MADWEFSRVDEKLSFQVKDVLWILRRKKKTYIQIHIYICRTTYFHVLVKPWNTKDKNHPERKDIALATKEKVNNRTLSKLRTPVCSKVPLRRWKWKKKGGKGEGHVIQYVFHKGLVFRIFKELLCCQQYKR